MSTRASELRSARFLILELYPCLASKDEQAIKECIFSEYGALDAYVDLVQIEDALLAIGYDELAKDPDREEVRRISRRPRPDRQDA